MYLGEMEFSSRSICNTDRPNAPSFYMRTLGMYANMTKWNWQQHWNCYDSRAMLSVQAHSMPNDSRLSELNKIRYQVTGFKIYTTKQSKIRGINSHYCQSITFDIHSIRNEAFVGNFMQHKWFQSVVSRLELASNLKIFCAYEPFWMWIFPPRR